MTIQQTTSLGGSASQIKVAKIAHGLMMMTWRDKPVPEEEAFESIKAGIDALPPGVKMFLNSGEFYARDLGTGNLELVARFFEKYPEYVDKTFLSVKGGNLPKALQMDASPENLRRSVETINSALRGTKKLDLFQCARVDRNVPVEEAMKTLKGLQEEGLFDHIGISECKADTLARAYSVVPIAAVEIEVSPWSYEDETKKVLATAEKLGVAVVAYSPLGRGFLTGAIKSVNDLAETDMRRHFTRFKEENINQNIVLVEALTAIADKKGITPAQLSIAWVSSLGQKVIPLPGSSHVKRTKENLGGGDVILTADEKAELDKLIAEYKVHGDRYFGDDNAAHLWG